MSQVLPTYHGSCHCGEVTFEARVAIERVTVCNCSICSKKGFLHQRVQPGDFRLLSGEGSLGTYQFGSMVARHHFCTRCGIHVFTRPRAAPELYTINVRCLDDFDLATAAVDYVDFDGRNWEANAQKLG
ncbi:GFA family protein [Herbaspirillum robiniae]|uniref:GFA family protein n=1 Tax=Herbaspirillum robiniae TaxID=2014887 RepID=A0ABX2M0K8_9BURK|nr:GFA family protein [Herbaspirillum robiniae]NUU01151.1 GFA family protein [Herbaspirillum robiniae]